MKKKTLLKRHTHATCLYQVQATSMWRLRNDSTIMALARFLLMPPRHDMAIYKIVIVCYSCCTVLGWILCQLNQNCFGFGLKFTLMQSRDIHQEWNIWKILNKRWISIAHQPFSLVTKKRVKKITAKCASPNLVCQVHHFTVCQWWIWVPSLH